MKIFMNKSIDRSFLLAFFVVSLCIGLPLVICCGYRSYDYYYKSSYFIEVNGVVSGYRYDEVNKYDDVGTQAEVIDYVVDGRTYTIVNDLSTTYPMSIGTSVLVKYNPDDYSDAIIGSDSTTFIAFGIGGILILVASFISLFFYIKAYRNRDKFFD